ncbi:hypothetical protein HPP92_015951 [Vanilla planifolia]|uniref:BCAS3 domain-containing protein n=1 Tax=Vanilla planifolia TaxID=51239 RepID=A0A835QK51_VANPL|nr:hypothetical protein HPP92_015951 [Vanilla planifolia]
MMRRSCRELCQGTGGVMDSSPFELISKLFPRVHLLLRLLCARLGRQLRRPLLKDMKRPFVIRFDGLDLISWNVMMGSSQVLLLAFHHGFQVWDVEEAEDVRQLASMHDGPVSFLQIQKKPMTAKNLEDKFAGLRPLLVVAGDVSFSGEGNDVSSNSSLSGHGIVDMGSDNHLPTSVLFYSLRSHDHVHVLKFRAAIYSVRCSTRIVAIAQASQIHCFSASSLEKEYTILTYPVISGNLSAGCIGYGPLAVGPRWIAYSGIPVNVSNSNRVSPKHLVPSGFSSSTTSGSLVAHYAKESSKQLAAGIVTLGDMGYKKLSKYYSELLPDANGLTKSNNTNFKANGNTNGHILNTEHAGMVIVRDIVSKSVIVQFRAHKSPISALCFDPSGTLLVTASIRGHNINVFHIAPSFCSNSSAYTEIGSSIHLYRLQRGITNAIIQDISFSDDSQWVMVSSSHGTSHLFAISPSTGTAKIHLQDANCINDSYGSVLLYPYNAMASKLNHQSSFSGPIVLSVVSRIKNGNNIWKGAVSGAAAAATGKVNPISGAIASAFHNCKAANAYIDANSVRLKYYLLLFSPSGSIVQYVLRQSSEEGSGIDLSGFNGLSHGLSIESDSGFVVEPVQKWDICHKRNRRDRNDNMDVYGELGTGDNAKLQKPVKKVNSIYPTDGGSDGKVKLSAEGNHHLYISQVELQMHLAQLSLWARPGVSFQLMVNDTVDDQSTLSGEIEIEKITYRMVEARSEALKPVLDNAQMSIARHLRISPLVATKDHRPIYQSSASPEAATLSRQNSCSSVDPMPDAYFGGFEASAGTNESLTNTTDIISNIDPHLEHVNNREGLKVEAELEFL